MWVAPYWMQNLELKALEYFVLILVHDLGDKASFIIVQMPKP